MQLFFSLVLAALLTPAFALDPDSWNAHPRGPAAFEGLHLHWEC
jgi:hypothetical protein